jgi:hypothetical protein
MWKGRAKKEAGRTGGRELRRTQILILIGWCCETVSATAPAIAPGNSGFLGGVITTCLRDRLEDRIHVERFDGALDLRLLALQPGCVGRGELDSKSATIANTLNNNRPTGSVAVGAG